MVNLESDVMLAPSFIFTSKNCSYEKTIHCAFNCSIRFNCTKETNNPRGSLVRAGRCSWLFSTTAGQHY